MSLFSSKKDEYKNNEFEDLLMEVKKHRIEVQRILDQSSRRISELEEKRSRLIESKITI